MRAVLWRIRAQLPFLKKFIEAHPDHIVITYINCSAEIKALSHLVCTSSNAEKIVNSVPTNIPIIFAPDKNLATISIKKQEGKWCFGMVPVWFMKPFR